jgi:hypothetical protein
MSADPTPYAQLPIHHGCLPVFVFGIGRRLHLDGINGTAFLAEAASLAGLHCGLGHIVGALVPVGSEDIGGLNINAAAGAAIAYGVGCCEMS